MERIVGVTEFQRGFRAVLDEVVGEARAVHSDPRQQAKGRARSPMRTLRDSGRWRSGPCWPGSTACWSVWMSGTPASATSKWRADVEAAIAEVRRLMRAVLDTNVLVRALIKPTGHSGTGSATLRDGDYHPPLRRAALLEELVDVLEGLASASRYRLAARRRRRLSLTSLPSAVKRVEPDRRDRRLPRSTAMMCFLQVAVAGRADVIVSGDKDLLVLSPFAGIPIVGPAAIFLCHARRRTMRPPALLNEPGPSCGATARGRGSVARHVPPDR